MKKLILMLFLINITGGFSQWQKIESPRGDFIISKLIDKDDELLMLCQDSRIILLDTTLTFQEFESNLDRTIINPDNAYTTIFKLIKDVIYLANTTGIYSSNDYGVNWNLIRSDLRSSTNLFYLNDNFYLLNNRKLYKGENLTNIIKDENLEDFTFEYLTYKDSVIYGMRQGVFVKSNDYGDSFDSLYNLKSFVGNPMSLITDMEIQGSSIAVCDNENGFYYSTDLGKNWDYQYYRGVYNIEIAGDTAVLTSNSGIYYSFDNMQTWQISKGTSTLFPTGLKIKNENIYTITREGMYLSKDNGVSWEKFDMNLSNIPVYDINYKKDTLFASLYYNFIQFSDTTDYDWKKTEEIKDAEIIPTSRKTYIYNDHIFSNGFFIVYHSSVNSKKWEKIYDGLLIMDLKLFDDKIFIARNNSNVVYSDDFGESWNDVLINEDYLVAKYFFLHKNEFYAANSNSGILYKYDANADSWMEFKYSKINNIRNLLSYDNDIIITSSNEIFRFFDNKGTVEKVSETESFITNIINYGPNFFVTTSDNGIMLSTDTCKTWTEINDGLSKVYPYGSIKDIKIYGDKLFAATNKGIYKRDLTDFSLTSVNDTESRNYLYTYPPYPQPASTEVRSLVYWDTSLEMNTESVKIYNTNGVEVSREQDISFERLNAYSGYLIWNCTNVPDGVYLIQISHGDREQTIKVMVRK